MTKRIFALLWVVILLFTMAACRRSDPLIEEEAMADQGTPSVGQDSEQTSSPAEEPENEAAAETEEPEEKALLYVTSTEVRYSREELIQRADLILRGTVEQDLGYVMTNPDNSRVNAAGEYSPNSQITTYRVSVSQVYKGDYTDGTIQLKTKNGRALSPDLILYGEDEENVLAQPLARLDLEVGKEYLFLITQITDAVFEEETGYFPVASAGYLHEKGGFFVNDSLSSPVRIPVSDAEDVITAALS